MTHLSIDQLRAWRDAPNEADRASVVAHLAVCNACAHRYGELLRSRPAADDSVSPPVADFVARGMTLSPASPAEVKTPGPIVVRSMAAHWALAAGVVLAVGLAAWQATELRRLRSEVATLEAERSARTQESAPARRPEASAGAPKATAPLLSLFLTPGRTRAEGQTKTLAMQDGANVRLMLALDGQRTFASYNVEIRNADGASVWTRNGVAPQEQMIILTVPGQDLKEDDYELVLRGVGVTGESERVGNYYFTVLAATHPAR